MADANSTNVLNFPNGGEQFKPALTHEQVGLIEKKVQEDTGINRRILLLVLTMNSKKLIETALEQPEVVFDMFECGAEHYLNQFRLLHMQESACWRLMAALKELSDGQLSPEQLDTAERLFGEVMSHRLEDDTPTD